MMVDIKQCSHLKEGIKIDREFIKSRKSEKESKFDCLGKIFFLMGSLKIMSEKRSKEFIGFCNIFLEFEMRKKFHAIFDEKSTFLLITQYEYEEMNIFNNFAFFFFQK